MLNSKRLLELARKWHKAAAQGRRRILAARTNGNGSKGKCNATVASRGHVFVYSNDGKRYMVPLKYLTNSIFRELFRISEEEFGLPSDGPITLPCNASFIEYILSLIPSRVSVDVERIVLSSIASSSRCSVSSFPPLGHDQQHVILGF